MHGQNRWKTCSIENSLESQEQPTKIGQKKKSNSNAVYAGNSAGDFNSIQIRAKNNESGIVTTTSGGKAKKITVTFNSNTATSSARVLQIYGKNTPYESAADLYDNNKKGELLASVTHVSSTAKHELTWEGDYEYIGIRSEENTIYLSEIKIEWEVPEASTEFGIHVTPEPGTYTEPQTIQFTVTGVPEGETATITYNTGEGGDQTYTEPFKLYKNATITVMAECGDKSDIQEYTYTINLPALAFEMTPAPGTYRGEQNVTIACTNAVSDLTVVWAYTPEEGNPIEGNETNMTFTAAKSGVLTIMAQEANTSRKYNTPDEGLTYTITEPISLDGMIVFKDNDTDGSNDLTNNNFKYQITKGADCIESASFNKVYSGTSGIKFSTGSVGGTMTLNLANKWNATKISFIAKNWASSNGTFDQATMTVNDNNTFDLTNEFNLYEVTLTEPQEITALTFVANKRAYLKVINIEGQEIILEKTATPEISVTEGEEAYTVTATGAGTVKLYKDGDVVENPCTVGRTSEEQTFVFTATAQEEGKDISDVATKEVTVPALPVVQSFGITVTPEAGTYTEPVLVTITATGLEEGQTATITYRLNGGDEQTYTEPFTLSETTAVSVRATFGDKVATWTGTYTINLPIENPTGLIVFKSNNSASSSALDGEGLIDEIDGDGKDYVLSAENIVNVYAGQNGLKFGTRSENGSMTLNLRGTWNANKISIIAKNYDDNAKFKVTVNGNSKEFNLSNDKAFRLYEFQLEQAQEVSAITFESTNRAYLKVINIEGEAPVIYRIKVDNEEGAYKGRADVKATLEPELESAKLFYTFAEDGATETLDEQPYPEAGVTVLKSGKLTFIARNGETELARWEGNYTITPLIGDVNGDGKVDVQDVNYVVNIILGKINPNE